jgi:hypothetical protein
MIRNTVLALAATAALLGTTELGTSTAQAGTDIRFGFYAGHRHGCFRPVIYAPVVIRPVVSAPVVYAPVSPVIVTNASPAFDVMVRNSQSAPWQLYGSFPNYQAAQAAVPNLQSSGLWVMIDQH